MKKLCILVVLTLSFAVTAAAEDWHNVSIIDTQCATKSAANPDAHKRSCALACSKSGFGIIDQSGNYLRFDDKGNQQAIKLLESSNEQDHLRVNVSGKKEGNVIHVESLKLM
jgi:hypothetical protein